MVRVFDLLGGGGEGVRGEKGAGCEEGKEGLRAEKEGGVRGHQGGLR